MSRISPSDRILALGVALEQGRHEVLIINIPVHPGYALFRSQGLQIVPNEALELDTGGQDTLIVTPRADIVSGVLLQIVSALPCLIGSPELALFVQETAIKLRKARMSPSADWETKALSEIIALGLDLAKRLKMAPRRKRAAEGIPDTRSPLRHRPEMPPETKRKMRDGFLGWAEAFEGSIDPIMDWGPLPDNARPSRLTLVICRMPGKVVGNLWLPLPSTKQRLSQGLIDRICLGVAQRDLDASYARVILGEMLARSLEGKGR